MRLPRVDALCAGECNLKLAALPTKYRVHWGDRWWHNSCLAKYRREHGQ